MRYLKIFLAIYIFMSCSNSTQTEENQEIVLQYPTILTSLSEESIDALQREFDSLNKNRICTTLNKFGYTGRDYCWSPAADSIITEEHALHLALDALVLNSKFTNVIDSSDLNVGSMVRHAGGKKWRITFEDQVYMGYEIINSTISVSITGNEVYRIAGFWFKTVAIPKIDSISQIEAKESIIGEQITWYDWGGNPVIYTIEEESILEIVEKVIFPYDINDTIELRVVWKIGIDSHNWDIFVDTSSGEIVAINQNFMT